MRIVLNGDPADVPGPLTVLALLEHLKIDPRLVAVEHDRVIVKRARYGETLVTADSEIEIVGFVGGGRA